MAKRTPALIFDFGNVVAHFDYARACERLGRPLRLSGAELLKRVRVLGFTELVREYERGQIDAKAFSSQVARLAGLDISHDEFAAAWSDIFWLNEPVARLIGVLKRQGYSLTLGSNTNDLHAAQFRGQFAETLRHFDRLVLSYEIGHIKPSVEFYLECARAAATEPQSCVFIDDVPENVEGARAAGLSGVLYRDVPSLVVDLRTLGVEVPGDFAN